MRFSLEWLRSLSPFEATDELVAAALTGRGLTVDALDGAGAEATLDIDVPANRPDCLGHLGVARELSAAFDSPLASRERMPASGGSAGNAPVEVRIDEPELCRRYTASVVRGVRVGPSPAWVVRRLELSGMRSINNVVDASNLVLLETGNPIHFFDLRRLSDGRVVVRLAKDGERLTALDGVERKLNAETLVIADRKHVIALAGVIGGAETEIQEDTSEVLIEAAWFAPSSVRRTSRRLDVATDASHRFGRGVDLEALPDVQALAIRLLTELADGRADPGLIDAYPRPFEPRTLELRLDEVERLLGYRPTDEEVRGALEALSLAPSALDGGRVAVQPPPYRGDLQREVDLVEEVARHLGYDRIPSTTPEITLTETSGPVHDEELVRDVVAPLGFAEVFGYSMIGSGDDDRFAGDQAPPPLRIENPISGAMSRLRRSLLPGLLRSLDLNLRRGTADVRLFEVGRVFLSVAAGELPREPRRVGLAWSGRGRTPHWGEPSRDVDLYDLSGAVERVIDALRPRERPAREPFELPAFHPGHSVRWMIGTTEVAQAGRLHPELEQQLKQPALMAEIDLEALIGLRLPLPRYRPVPRVGAVSRDLAVVLDASTTFRRVIEALGEVDPPAEVGFNAVDRYVGAPLAAGESAVTVRITLHPRDQSLTDEQIESYRQALILRLGKLGVQIRG